MNIPPIIVLVLMVLLIKHSESINVISTVQDFYTRDTFLLVSPLINPQSNFTYKFPRETMTFQQTEVNISYAGSSYVQMINNGELAVVFSRRYCVSDYVACRVVPENVFNDMYLFVFHVRQNGIFLQPKLLYEPCVVRFDHHDSVDGVFSDGSRVYYFENEGDIKYLDYAKGECKVSTYKARDTFPAMRMWMLNSFGNNTLYYVSQDVERQLHITRHQIGKDFDSFSLPNDPLFSFGWTMHLAYDERNGDLYLHNTNSERANSLWRITPDNQFTLLSSGTTGPTNIAMTFLGQFAWQMRDGYLWNILSGQFTPWSVDTLARSTSYQTGSPHPDAHTQWLLL